MSFVKEMILTGDQIVVKTDIYIYICEASCVSHVLCVRIIVEGTCHAQDH